MPFDINMPQGAKSQPHYQFLSLSPVDPADHPLCRKLGKRGHLDIHALPLRFDQSSRIRMILFGWPRLFLDSVRLAWQSLATVRRDTVIFFDGHLSAFCWLLLWRLARRGPSTAKLVLGGMIYTPRTGFISGLLKKAYFSWLLKRLDLVTCYSRSEKRGLAKLTGGQTAIRVVHYGIGEGWVISNWIGQGNLKHEPSRWHSAKPLTVFSAGRSSRDYATLVRAVTASELGTKHPAYLDIVCDNIDTAPPELESDFVMVHRSLYGADYIKKMIQADIVVVPLSNQEISAGQMVFLHALAAGKPIIVTDNLTVREYLSPSKYCHLVPMGDAQALAASISAIAADLPASNEDILRQRALYANRFTSDHLADRLIAAMEAEWPSAQQADKQLGSILQRSSAAA